MSTAQKITLISSIHQLNYRQSSDWVFGLLGLLTEPHEAYDAELRKSGSLKLLYFKNMVPAGG